MCYLRGEGPFFHAGLEHVLSTPKGSAGMLKHPISQNSVTPLKGLGTDSTNSKVKKKNRETRKLAEGRQLKRHVSGNPRDGNKQTRKGVQWRGWNNVGPRLWRCSMSRSTINKQICRTQHSAAPVPKAWEGSKCVTDVNLFLASSSLFLLFCSSAALPCPALSIALSLSVPCIFAVGSGKLHIAHCPVL